MKAPNLEIPSKPSSKNDNNSNSKSICQNHLKAITAFQTQSQKPSNQNGNGYPIAAVEIHKETKG